MLSREETQNLNFEQINEKLQQVLTNIIDAHIEELDPRLPSILAAHVWVSGARVGSESSMTIGQEHVLLKSNLTNPAFDYVALGHIHKSQVLSQEPPVVYAGSLERLDFSEEADDKGFYVVEIDPDREKGKRCLSFDFHPVSGRRFVTIDVNLEPQDVDPTATIISAIRSAGEDKIGDAIVRLQVSLPAEMEGQLRDGDIREVLTEAHHLIVAKEVKREVRSRLGDRSAEEITPIEALQAYLESKNESPERVELLLKYGGADTRATE